MIKPKLRINVHCVRQGIVTTGLILALGGCVSVAAPEKPIEINLNINIRQEVLVKLERDVQNLIDKNPGVF